MVAWPGSLPQDVLVDGYDEQFPDMVLRTQMDAGPAKTRRRFTAAVRPMHIETDMTRTQLATFETFVRDDLAGGALPFDWVNPRTLGAVSFRFTQPPSWRPHPGAKLWRVRMDLEVMP